MPLLYYVFLGWRWTRQKYNCPVVLSPYSTQKTGLCWEPNINEIDAINMKSTWPTPVPPVVDPPPPIFHLLTFGTGVVGNANVSVCVGGNANFSVFRYRHVGIPNAKLWRWGSKPK